MSENTYLHLKLAILNDNGDVLTLGAGATRELPQVAIPRFTRPAYAATRAVKEKYGLSIFVILSARYETEGEQLPAIDGLVLVCRLQDSTAADGFGWMPVEHVAAQGSQADQAALEAAFPAFERYDSGLTPSSFGRFRALDDLREWYTPFLAELGVREAGIQQWNGDPWFALFRIAVEPMGEPTPATPKALWCKAVGEPNTREFAVTKALCQECPYWFAPLVATKDEWNAWLMKEVDGHELDVEPDGRPWALTARILAQVQKRFVGREDELLALGCRDWRTARVLESLDSFFDRMEEIMRRQKTEAPRPLSTGELRILKAECRDLCHRVEDVDIPDTIAHGDFSPHNVIVHGGWPVLIDWAEAYVAFPFISWEYFWNRTVKDHPDYQGWYERMHRNYAYRIWEPLLGRRRVDEGMRLSPAMAVLIHALYGLDQPSWGDSEDAGKAKRSLVRRLQRELQVSQPVGAL